MKLAKGEPLDQFFEGVHAGIRCFCARMAYSPGDENPPDAGTATGFKIGMMVANYPGGFRRGPCQAEGFKDSGGVGLQGGGVAIADDDLK